MILLLALIAVGFAFTVLIAILGPLGREVGMSELQISSIIAASSLVVFLASPRWGRLSDRWGRKRVMVIGLFGYACGNLLFASVFHLTLVGALLPLTGYLLLMLTRVMHASVMSAIMPSSSAYMADITSTATRTKGMGAVGGAAAHARALAQADPAGCTDDHDLRVGRLRRDQPRPAVDVFRRRRRRVRAQRRDVGLQEREQWRAHSHGEYNHPGPADDQRVARQD